MNTKKFSDAMSELDTKYVDEALHYNQKAKKPIWIKWGIAAACLLLAVTSVFTVSRMTENANLPQLEMTAPAADAPTGMRKFMNFDGRRYVFLENGATYHLSDQQLQDALGTLEYDIQTDPQTNSQKEFSTTFALGGTVYQLTDYDPAFRISVEWNGDYYLCQAVGLTDNTPMDVAEHFKAARFPETINEVSIYDHAGVQMLADFPSSEIEALIDTLAQSMPAQLSDEDYQQIAKAQNEGQSYQLFFSLNDGTIYHLYVIPSLEIAMIGDGRYVLPESFAEDFGSLFEGLSQNPLPAQ